VSTKVDIRMLVRMGSNRETSKSEMRNCSSVFCDVKSQYSGENKYASEDYIAYIFKANNMISNKPS
jgi:hypothetical protein